MRLSDAVPRQECLAPPAAGVPARAWGLRQAATLVAKDAPINLLRGGRKS